MSYPVGSTWPWFRFFFPFRISDSRLASVQDACSAITVCLENLDVGFDQGDRKCAQWTLALFAESSDSSNSRLDKCPLCLYRCVLKLMPKTPSRRRFLHSSVCWFVLKTTQNRSGRCLERDPLTGSTVIHSHFRSRINCRILSLILFFFRVVHFLLPGPVCSAAHLHTPVAPGYSIQILLPHQSRKSHAKINDQTIFLIVDPANYNELLYETCAGYTHLSLIHNVLA